MEKSVIGFAAMTVTDYPLYNFVLVLDKTPNSDSCQQTLLASQTLAHLRNLLIMCIGIPDLASQVNSPSLADLLTQQFQPAVDVFTAQFFQT
jgi:hypothetical protein